MFITVVSVLCILANLLPPLPPSVFCVSQGQSDTVVVVVVFYAFSIFMFFVRVPKAILQHPENTFEKLLMQQIDKLMIYSEFWLRGQLVLKLQ